MIGFLTIQMFEFLNIQMFVFLNIQMFGFSNIQEYLHFCKGSYKLKPSQTFKHSEVQIEILEIVWRNVQHSVGNWSIAELGEGQVYFE